MNNVATISYRKYRRTNVRFWNESFTHWSSLSASPDLFTFKCHMPSVTNSLTRSSRRFLNVLCLYHYCFIFSCSFLPWFLSCFHPHLLHFFCFCLNLGDLRKILKDFVHTVFWLFLYLTYLTYTILRQLFIAFSRNYVFVSEIPPHCFIILWISSNAWIGGQGTRGGVGDFLQRGRCHWFVQGTALGPRSHQRLRIAETVWANNVARRRHFVVLTRRPQSQIEQYDLHHWWWCWGC